MIKDIKIFSLTPFVDSRGQFMETFRKEWFPVTTWDNIQMNFSMSNAGVLRGLHYHLKQVDYWTVARGQIQVGLYDTRPNSTTHKKTQMIEMNQDSNTGLLIPVGVAHGFFAREDTILVYLTNQYYAANDEFGIAWNDPDVGMDWGCDDPVISDRDRTNPFLKDIPVF